MGARLVHATLPPYQLTPEQRDVRVAAALAWLSALAIEASLRPLLQALYEAAGGQGTHHGAATALQAVRGELGNALDSRSAAELDALASRLTQAAVPSSSSEEGDAAGPARARDRSPG